MSQEEAGFQLDDRIVCYYETGDELAAVVNGWSDYIQGETLSLELVPGRMPDDVAGQESFKLGGYPATVGIKKA